jgi:hypothetical protein
MATNGKPTKKDVLLQINRRTLHARLVAAYSIMAVRSLSLRMLGGKTGSWMDPLFSRKTSQPARAMAAMIASTNGEIMAALFHGYRLPPSSRAKTISTEEMSNRNMPQISTRTNPDLDNLTCRRSRNVSLELLSDVGRHHVIKTRATRPPGTLVLVNVMLSILSNYSSLT